MKIYFLFSFSHIYTVENGMISIKYFRCMLQVLAVLFIHCHRSSYMFGIFMVSRTMLFSDNDEIFCTFHRNVYIQLLKYMTLTYAGWGFLYWSHEISIVNCGQDVHQQEHCWLWSQIYFFQGVLFFHKTIRATGVRKIISLFLFWCRVGKCVLTLLYP